MEAATSGHGPGGAVRGPTIDPSDAERCEALARSLDPIREALVGVLRGQEQIVEYSLACLLAGGHLLLEDAPGTGKTTLARALALASGLAFQRVQMTADLLPADVTGARYPVLQGGPQLHDSVGLHQSTGRSGGPELRFVPGPIFSQVVLADELNRTPPRTQSALLESMAERHVTVEGERHELPRPFFVIATQNPIEFAGTFPLPESQLDRFMMRLSPGYPDREAERQLLRDRRRGDPLDGLGPAIDESALLRAIQATDDIVVHEAVEDYVLDITSATRTSDSFELGVSPRGVLDLERAARALALLDGRSFVLPEDVRRMVGPVLVHRLVTIDAGADPDESGRLLDALLSSIPAPQIQPDGSLGA